MSKVIHNFNNNSKSWKIHAYNLQSVGGDDLNLSASENNNIYLNVSGGLVNTTYLDVSNNLRVYGNAVFANDLQTDNSSVKIPNTYNNYAFVNHVDLLTNLTNAGNSWIDLSGSGYIVNYTPLSNNSKVFLHAKISYIASAESEQLISFQLLRVINGTETTLFSDMSFGSIFGTIQNGIYNFDYVDSPDSSANISYYLKYKIYQSNGDSIDISSGVVGYDNNNINCFMAQELYIPSMDGIIQTVNTSLGNVFLDNRDASFNNVDISGTLNASNSNNAIKYSSHLIPTTNDTFDIGSAEYKVRDLYVADNSIFIGDKNKLGIDDTGGLIIMERDTSVIPSGIYEDTGITINDSANVLLDISNKLQTSFESLSDVKLEDWQKYSDVLTNQANIQAKTLNEIYKPITNTDWKSKKTISNLLNEYSDASFGNLDISGGVINFFASDEQILGPDTGIAQKVQDLSNAITNSLISNNDASFNNVDISGNLNVNGDVIVSGNVTANNIGVNFAYYEINASQVDMRSNPQIVYGNEVVANAFITRNVANNEFTFNQAGMYKIESSAWFAGQPSTQSITFAEIKAYHRLQNGTLNFKQISLLDPRGNTGEDYQQMTFSLCYILNASIGDSIYTQGSAIAPTQIRTVGAAGASYNSSTNLIITKLT